MTKTLTDLTTEIRDSYLAIVATNTRPDYDAEAMVVLDREGDIGLEIMEHAEREGLLVVDADDYQDSIDFCYRIADDVKAFLAAKVSPDRIHAAQEVK